MGQLPVQELLAKAQEAAKNQRPFSIKSFKLPPDTEQNLEHILRVFLRELEQEILTDPLAYCLRELAVNSKKANTKRVYFEEKGLDLSNDVDYEQGMRTFKSDTLGNIDYWLQKQEEAGLYIRISFQIQGRSLTIRIANNTLVTRKEQIRIYDRIARSRAFRNMEEALTSVLDDTEGAGLGIVILVLMLKKIGLDEEAFDIDVEENETVARLVIPMDDIKVEQLNEISDELATHVESLPQFPESIQRLQSLLNDEDAEIVEIARVLGQDPSLTADLLKTVNSARFMLPRRMDNVIEAVKMVGLRGLKQMLFSYGTQRVLGDGEENEVTRALWEHSQRTAFYAYALTRSVLKRKDIIDDVYVGAILHDMGKIVFSNLHPDVVSHMQDFSKQKGIPSSIFEEMSSGIDHAELGARIAEKWNFPDVLVSSIRFHHAPMHAPAALRDVVAVIYISNEMANTVIGEYEHVDLRVMKMIGINGADQLGKVHERLAEQHDQQFARLESTR